MPRERKSLRYYEMAPAWVKRRESAVRKIEQTYSVRAEWPVRLDLQSRVSAVATKFGGEQEWDGSGSGYKDISWGYGKNRESAISAAKLLSKMSNIKVRVVQQPDGSTIWGLDGIR